MKFLCKLLGLGLCMYATVHAQPEQAKPAGQNDAAKAWVEKGKKFARGCSEGVTNPVDAEKIAVMRAADAIVKMRQGVVVDGRESTSDKQYETEIYESSVGVVGKLRVVSKMASASAVCVVLEIR